MRGLATGWFFKGWASTQFINEKSTFRPSCMDCFEYWKETFYSGLDVCFCIYALPVISSNNQFLGVLDALEWWERKSSDTQPSRNESIKWLPPRNCYIFKCLWEYLPSLSPFPLLASCQHLKSFLLTHVISSWFSAVNSLGSCRKPIVEIPLPLL